MSKLSPSLKALIGAPFAKPGPIPAPNNIRSVFEGIAKSAASHNVGVPAWLSVATATTMTMNSPDSLAELYKVAAPKQDEVQTAEFMREVGLKCIGFNGTMTFPIPIHFQSHFAKEQQKKKRKKKKNSNSYKKCPIHAKHQPCRPPQVPRTINMLGAFRASLPATVVSALRTTGTRMPTPANIAGINARGFELWKSIYHPLDGKLYDKLAASHPDMPIFILHSEYGALFADPAEIPQEAKVGRVLTSVVAVACLRAQSGVGPQVTSHVFGLRKAYEDGSAARERAVDGGEWLATNEGSTWLLETVDGIVAAISGGAGSSFAAPRAKL
ncbi:hypothetical protein MBLNU459_g2857t1 [Dothideomycetes sp. NU459]